VEDPSELGIIEMPKLRLVKRNGTIAYKMIEDKKQIPSMLRSTVILPKPLSLNDDTEESKCSGFNLPVLRPMSTRHAKTEEDEQVGGFKMPVLRPVVKAKPDQKKQKTVGFTIPENRPMKKAFNK